MQLQIANECSSNRHQVQEMSGNGCASRGETGPTDPLRALGTVVARTLRMREVGSSILPVSIAFFYPVPNINGHNESNFDDIQSPVKIQITENIH